MLHRRTLLLGGLAAASVGLPLRIFAGEGFLLSDFIGLSASLTGVPTAKLDRGVARILYDAYDERGLLPGLAHLADQTHPAAVQSPLGDEITAAWYSGICQTANGPIVAAYTSALIWANSSALHPASTCGGKTGYWGDPPPI